MWFSLSWSCLFLCNGFTCRNMDFLLAASCLKWFPFGGSTAHQRRRQIYLRRRHRRFSYAIKKPLERRAGDTFAWLPDRCNLRQPCNVDIVESNQHDVLGH